MTANSIAHSPIEISRLNHPGCLCNWDCSITRSLVDGHEQITSSRMSPQLWLLPHHLTHRWTWTAYIIQDVSYIMIAHSLAHSPMNIIQNVSTITTAHSLAHSPMDMSRLHHPGCLRNHDCILRYSCCKMVSRRRSEQWIQQYNEQPPTNKKNKKYKKYTTM